MKLLFFVISLFFFLPLSTQTVLNLTDSKSGKINKSNESITLISTNTNLEKSNFTKSTFGGATVISFSNLRKCNFSSSQHVKSVLFGCNLDKTCFRKAEGDIEILGFSGKPRLKRCRFDRITIDRNYKTKLRKKDLRWLRRKYIEQGLSNRNGLSVIFLRRK